MILCCCAGGCTVTVSGNASACDGSGTGSGVTVAVRDHATGAVLGSATTNGFSHYSVTFTIAGSSQAVDVVASKAGACAGTTTVTVSCGANTVNPSLSLCPFVVTANGCGAIPGVSITFSQTGYTSTQTTDGSGHVTFSPVSTTAAGTITVNSVPAGYAVPSPVSFTPSCNGTGTTVSVPTATNYSCTPPGCCPGILEPGPPYYAPGIPPTLYINDGIGVITLTSGAFGSTGWEGCAQRTTARGYDATACSATPVSRSVPVFFYFTCQIDGSWLLEIKVKGCSTFGVCGNFPSSGDCDPTHRDCLSNAIAHTSGDASDCPDSFTWTGTLTNLSGSTLTDIYGTSTPTMTVTQ